MAFNFGGAATTATPPQQQQLGGGGLSFGNPSSGTTTATGGFGSGGFGSTAPTATSTGAAAPATSSAFGFGQQQQPATSTTSLFSNPAGAGTGLQQPATSTAPTLGGFGGGFGSSSLGGSSSLFGNKGTTTSGGFGGGFGSSTNATTSLGGFGSGLGGGLTGTNTMNQQQRDRQIWQLLLQVDDEARRQQAALLTTGEQYKPQNIWQALALLKSWWDPQSPYCRFKHYFYNLVPQEQVHLYQKPASHDKKAWDEAQKKNPDPSRFVPALAIGFEDVKKRMEAQERQSLAQIAILKETQAKVDKLRNTDAVATAKKLEEYKTRHMELIQRVIWLLKKAQVLRNKGVPLTADEEKLRATLENIQEQLVQSEQFHGKLSQLWAQLQLIKESGRKYGKLDDVHGWNGVSSDNRESITKVLGEQQTGIQHTMDILEKNQRDVEMMKNHYELHN
ncbi:nucleoporin complex subunit 54-domain-containing protein [Zychaea mexicana]|uniref:nucleoporin complex subunit 54-domain-containing protein n=1 Tax=Zychaea mexicana TaxID=64656 RepID=UPI0022FECB58|nr:nucleoporin complex subunit 54-domain-containing protein [Zychaea mexicana]KAI9494689.1 nucleoporin complex subunit 54-domain-containing protein [Zychaea mexicana]